MVKLTKRKGFNFYRSYYDVFNELNDKDKLDFIKALLNKQFLDVEPPKLTGMVNFAWIGQYNSIDQQVKGYKSKSKDPMQGGVIRGEITPTLQEEGKEEGKEEVQCVIQSKIDFDNLLILINKQTGRNFQVINSTIQAKYKARLKDGYTKEDISNTIKNSVKDDYHKETNFKYLTPEYFSRAVTIDKFSQGEQKREIKRTWSVANSLKDSNNDT